MRRLLLVLALALVADHAAAACKEYLRPSTSGAVSYQRHWVCDTSAEKPAGQAPGDTAFALDNTTFYTWVSDAWQGLVGGGGGGAPTDAQYVTVAAHPDLSAEIVATAAGLALLDDADAAAQRTTLGLGSLATQGGTFSGTSSGTNTGDQTSVSGNAGTATALAADPADCATSTHFAVGLNAAGVATCEAIADADVPNTITLDSLTQITTRAIADTTGTLAMARGGTDNTTAPDDNVLIGSGTAWVLKAINDCQGAGKALTYTASSNTWGCNTISGGGGGATVARVAADVSNTSNTVWADVTGLTHAVSASTAYSFTCQLSYTSAATTTALHLSINGPASPTAMRYTVEMSTTATARHNASQSAYNTVTNPATGGGSTALPAQIKGTLENGANAGTLAIRLKSEISASAVTIQRGSWCEFY